MKHFILSALAAGLMLGTAPAAQSTELIIYHTWSTPAEVAALTELRTELEAKGHSWKDLAIPHNSGVNVSLINMITGGEPPERVRELRSQPLSRPRGPRARVRSDRVLQLDRRHR